MDIRGVTIWVIAVATASAIALFMEPLMPPGDWKWLLVAMFGALLMWLLRRREAQAATKSTSQYEGKTLRQRRKEAMREAAPAIFWWLVAPLALFVMIGWLLHELGV